MGLLPLKEPTLIDWPAVDLILTSLFAAIITVNLLLLRRRVHRLERHKIFGRKIFDLEDGHDVELLNKFCDLQTTEWKNGPLDKKAFQCFMDLAGGKIPSLDPKCKDQEMAARYEELLVAVVKFFHPELSEASVNEKQELGAVVATPDYTAAVLDEPQSKEAGHVTESRRWCGCSGSPSKPFLTDMEKDELLSQIYSSSLGKCCSGCSKKMAPDKLNGTCSPLDCGRQWCDSCIDSIEESTSHLGDLTRAYCTSCGNVLTCHGLDLSFPREAVYIVNTLRNLKYTSVQMASCVAAKIGGGIIDFVAYDIDLASGQAHLSPLDLSKTSSKGIKDERALSVTPNLNRMTSEEDSSQPSSKKLVNVPGVTACWSKHQEAPYYLVFCYPCQARPQRTQQQISSIKLSSRPLSTRLPPQRGQGRVSQRDLGSSSAGRWNRKPSAPPSTSR
ncbi:hypothetical protein GJ744_003858 [Endocarpon pusillum]|uniref:Uncharacterized protein n=1 Tax=Endocarpon pusillum TaxID=364733 RepID=A0A8H7AM34_9EURO|nr:hypothetical protein GJ744_003858 [Endocarpon pusillum]